MDKSQRISLHRTAHYFLEGLDELGLDYLFCNFGTDHAPLIEAMAAWQKAGRRFPRTVVCPHENTAVHMAAGYALQTGRGQGVMVHVDAGTANAAMALHNLRRQRIPVLVMAGRSPYTIRGELEGSRDNYVHFIQEPFDQGGLVRPYVKWEWTLPSGVVTKEALRRAHSVAHSDPQGPVYLVLPRETLTETWDEGAVRAFPADRYGAVTGGAADPAAIGRLAERLLGATHPILLTSYAGRNENAPALIGEIARFAGIRVFEPHASNLNISRASPNFAGDMPGAHLAAADVGLLVDVDVPWIPRQAKENPTTWWAHIDVDVIKQDSPMWGFANNLRLRGDSVIILGQLLEALKARATPAFHAAAAHRMQTITAEHEQRRAAAAKVAAMKGAANGVSPAYVSEELGRALGADDILLNEAVRNRGAVFEQIPRTRPGSYFGFAGGGLGAGAGMALGMKLAHPQRTVVHVAGDGVFYFGNPSSVFAVSKQYGLPVFTVVLDNSGWGAVKAAVLSVYPEGDAKALHEFHAQLAPQVEFGKIAEAAGGHAEYVSDPEQVRGAIERSLAAVRGGRSALMHVRIPSI